jgi:uncharacterized protein YbaR (Trm112 family)
LIDEELKAILVCPACKGELLFEESRIICPHLRARFPKRIPGRCPQPLSRQEGECQGV